MQSSAEDLKERLAAALAEKRSYECQCACGLMYGHEELYPLMRPPCDMDVHREEDHDRDVDNLCKLEVVPLACYECLKAVAKDLAAALDNK
jgi:hypothetical protein